ncbi:MAG: DUF5683 domain-containing protein [Bacteroidales bacterium]
MKIIKICILFFLLAVSAAAQVEESTRDSLKLQQAQDDMPSGNTRLLSPVKATMMAAAFPGLGQVYNRKYWKIPLVYAGFGALGYSIISNSQNFEESFTAYQDLTDDIPETTGYKKLIEGIYEPGVVDPALGEDSYDAQVNSTIKDYLLNRITYYRRYRDLSYIGVGFWYILSILDANVDAVMSDYDISPDLNVSVNPVPVNTVYGSTMGVGVKLTF